MTLSLFARQSDRCRVVEMRQLSKNEQTLTINRSDLEQTMMGAQLLKMRPSVWVAWPIG